MDDRHYLAWLGFAVISVSPIPQVPTPTIPLFPSGVWNIELFVLKNEISELTHLIFLTTPVFFFFTILFAKDCQLFFCLSPAASMAARRSFFFCAFFLRFSISILKIYLTEFGIMFEPLFFSCCIFVNPVSDHDIACHFVHVRARQRGSSHFAFILPP
jgi:hypothetical protein